MLAFNAALPHLFPHLYMLPIAPIECAMYAQKICELNTLAACVGRSVHVDHPAGIYGNLLHALHRPGAAPLHQVPPV